MAEYSRLAKGHFTSTGAAQIVNLPFVPARIEMYNYTAAGTPANHGIPYAYWDVSMGQGFATVDLFNATPVLTTGNITTNGFSTFKAGLLLQYGPVLNVSAITKASAAEITTSAAHGLVTGNVVVFSNLYETSTTGMQQIAGIPFTVTVIDSTHFTIPWNTNQSNFTAIDGSATVQGTVKQVLYPYLYAPNVAFISAISTGTTTTVTTTNAPNFFVGQEVAFRIPSEWGTTQLNSLPNSTTPGSPIYGYVISITNANTIVVNVNSTGYTAFNSNQPFTSFPGQSFAQIVAVGDVNTGGVQISSGSQLYPPPYIQPTGTTTVNTINGPAIQGAYINNTSQGFIIGSGATTSDASSVLVGANGNVIYWTAFIDDYFVN